MIIVWALSWWYGSGWKAFIVRLQERLASSYDYFSINLLASTLFAPFRQISAGRVNGSFAIKWQAFLDQLVSRVIGSIVRSLFIAIGSIWLLLQLLVGGLAALVWPLIPLLPFVGFIAMVAGWTPVWP